MEYRGSHFYDREEQFTRYMARRGTPENANDTLEEPVIWELAGDVTGRSVLDLGCGDGMFGLKLLNAGAINYTGIEGSYNMYRTAVSNIKELKSHAAVIHTTIEDWNAAPDHDEAGPENTNSRLADGKPYDLVVSRLVLHYIEDLGTVLDKIYAALKPGGTFVFSVEHPVITSTLQPSGLRTDWIVDQYFVEGYREQDWMGGPVLKYHRTIEDYFSALQKAGFVVSTLRESKPVRERFIHEETYERRRRIPLFLFMGAMKPE
ncbi:class I SAM-dependent methyltransferase [Neobacillus mesonae]|nr:class I SAM-dependent methyltransferase [Neobacillus mesonae]